MPSPRLQEFLARQLARTAARAASPSETGAGTSASVPAASASVEGVGTVSGPAVDGSWMLASDTEGQAIETLVPEISEERRKCWICFGEEGEGDDKESRWVKPCHCSLESHEECLLNWISENQKGIPLKKVRCPQCQAVYVLVEQRSLFMEIMSNCEVVVRSTVPYITILGFACSTLVTSTTYGAYVVLTMCGTEYGEYLLGGPNPWGWRVWVGLPMIPAGLIMSRIKSLNSFMLLFPLSIVGGPHFRLTWPPRPAATVALLPWIRMAYNGIYSLAFDRMERRWNQELSRNTNVDSNALGLAALLNDDGNVDEDALFEGMYSMVRSVIGALLLPAVASFCGSLLGRIGFVRSRVTDPFNRSVLGGCLFIVAKDLINLLYKYQRVTHRRSRRVRDVSERRGSDTTSLPESMRR
ncbi:hypothetical protein THASP1DRAFT_28002 [Thamnocephalis sphaerospora]|uniref:RING-CH-type domain-containing protein n=1 Tax=Thamnocephalis sphaerospora TaxID=78915 RepID=A0A4P9XX06_9FUNG|nr:hypothetical protein THASP1DRAFT_28002 [Thamnocephalis sphaerospora]|eukprot:RKP10201.1 hypothetical protein THASP1DRAFT_28002 [Thamnocephalis sphaerospora]